MTKILRPALEDTAQIVKAMRTALSHMMTGCRFDIDMVVRDLFLSYSKSPRSSKGIGCLSEDNFIRLVHKTIFRRENLQIESK
jgi:hypothetical protein